MIFLGFAEPAVGGLRVVIRPSRQRRLRISFPAAVEPLPRVTSVLLATVGHPATGPPCRHYHPLPPPPFSSRHSDLSAPPQIL